ncbi:MAG: 23S rRNA (guanosine(2251)-2'-O)-methyltransferase RlmB [Magnetococcales bacterium]|nr:23S rRNA (guanosine(2251)-2'-O)-methyltransferase RlmB [Magnetococcales bacterium]
MSEESGMIYGVQAVAMALNDPACAVESLALLKGERNQRLGELADLARERGIRFRFEDRPRLDRMTDGAVHQGAVARIAPRKQPSFDDILERIDGDESPPLLLLLDSIEDPRNLGAIMRSASAFGVMAVIATRDRSAPLSAVAVKASAGAAEHLDLVRVVNLARAIEQLRERGVWVLGLAGEGDLTLGEAPLDGAVALVMGHEGKGLRRLTRERCDNLISIPLSGQMPSLNVSVAAGIALYEVSRKRGTPNNSTS